MVGSLSMTSAVEPSLPHDPTTVLHVYSVREPGWALGNRTEDRRLLPDWAPTHRLLASDRVPKPHQFCFRQASKPAADQVGRCSLRFESAHSRMVTHEESACTLRVIGV